MVNPACREASDFNATIIEEFRANQGRVGGPLAGTPMILIHHIGARSGIERVTPLACNPQGDGRRRSSPPMEDRPPTQTGTTTSRPTPGSQSKWVPRYSPFWRRIWTAPRAPGCGRSWSRNPLPSANTRARPRDRFRSLCSSARTELRPESLTYGVGPAKERRRQRTAAATPSQATRARAATSAGTDPPAAGPAAPRAAGLPGAAGQPPQILRRSGVTPGHDDLIARVSRRAI